MADRISCNTESKIVELYKNGSGTCEIAKNLKINRCTVLKYLKEHKLNPQRITRPYKNKFNIHYFSKYTEQSAYWAGFIMADGNIGTKKSVVQIALANKDKIHLEKFAKSINFTGPLYEDKAVNASSIQIRGRWFINDLGKNYSIFNRKTFTCKMPDIPKKYVSHFIRGIFDGDGSIYIGSSITVSFIGNIELMKKIRNILHTTLKLKIKGHENEAPFQKTKSGGIVQFCYSADNAKKILKWMYKNSDDKIRLTRKYRRFKEWETKTN